MRQERLEAKMAEKKVKDQDCAKALGIDSSTFWRKKTGVNEFDRDEIKGLKTLMGLTAEEVDFIFFED